MVRDLNGNFARTVAVEVWHCEQLTRERLTTLGERAAGTVETVCW
jgi:hypothetical protein